ncbi:MAG: hypothetical protein AAF747_11155 [Planctomycetota bacterium]
MTQAAPANSMTTLAKRLADSEKKVALFRAVMACSGSRTRGKTSKLMKLPDDVLHRLAERFILGGVSVDTLRNHDMADELKGIARNPIYDWLRRVRKKFEEIWAVQLETLDAHQAAAAGDVSQVVYGYILEALSSMRVWLRPDTVEAMSTAEKHLLLRSCEMAEKVAKTFAESNFKEAQTARIQQQLVKLSDDIGSGRLAGQEAKDAIEAVIDNFALGYGVKSDPIGSAA